MKLFLGGSSIRLHEVFLLVALDAVLQGGVPDRVCQCTGLARLYQVLSEEVSVFFPSSHRVQPLIAIIISRTWLLTADPLFVKNGSTCIVL